MREDESHLIGFKLATNTKQPLEKTGKHRETP
jgi:hypothetical protein